MADAASNSAAIGAIERRLKEQQDAFADMHREQTRFATAMAESGQELDGLTKRFDDHEQRLRAVESEGTPMALRTAKTIADLKETAERLEAAQFTLTGGKAVVGTLLVVLVFPLMVAGMVIWIGRTFPAPAAAPPPPVTRPVSPP